MKILIVDDEQNNLRTLEMLLERAGYQVCTATNGEMALEELEKEQPEVMLTDLNMPIMNGMELLKHSKEKYPHIEVIVSTAFGTIDTAVEAMKLGAWDFLTKPLRRIELLEHLKKIENSFSLHQENQALKAEIAKMQPNWIGQSSVMRSIKEEAMSVADSEASVFLLGASGTGKSMLAKWIHSASRRNNGQFVTINCASIPETLMESELFGYEKGAFTGANNKKLGKLEQADRGTLFLDEVTEMTPQIQVKLLRVLQDGEFERVGGNQTITTNLRVIAASNRNIQEAIQSGRFREDLYYRLNVVQIELPELHKRHEDIPILIQYFLERQSKKNNRLTKPIHPMAMQLLQQWNWPGNVRELENTIERAVVLSKGDQIDVLDLPLNLRSQVPTDNILHFPVGTPIKDLERSMIVATLHMVDGDKNKAAEILGITARTIYRKEAEWKEEGFIF